VGDFRFLTPDEITQLNIMTITKDSPTGYIIQCDLQDTENLYPSHFDYPLAPGHLVVTKEMLSLFIRRLIPDT